MEEEVTELEESRSQTLAHIITREYRAYILELAAEAGVECEVTVIYESGEAPIPIPRQVILTAATEETGCEELCRRVEAEFGIPAQWNCEERDGI